MVLKTPKVWGNGAPRDGVDRWSVWSGAGLALGLHSVSFGQPVDRPVGRYVGRLTTTTLWPNVCRLWPNAQICLKKNYFESLEAASGLYSSWSTPSVSMGLRIHPRCNLKVPMVNFQFSSMTSYHVQEIFWGLWRPMEWVIGWWDLEATSRESK